MRARRATLTCAVRNAGRYLAVLSYPGGGIGFRSFMTLREVREVARTRGTWGIRVDLFRLHATRVKDRP